MSRRTDEDRKADAVESRIDTAKERLRKAQAVLTGFVQEEPRRVTAERLGISLQTVWRLRVWLGVEAKPTGKFQRRQHGSKASIDAVRVS